MYLCAVGQKRESGFGTSTSDKSSVVKSNSTPSTPQAENNNFIGSRFLNPLILESSPSTDPLSEVKHDRYMPDDNFLEQETTSVCSLR